MKYLLKKYLKSKVKQGSFQHLQSFDELFRAIKDEMQVAFFEDSEKTLKEYMKECIDKL